MYADIQFEENAHGGSSAIGTFVSSDTRGGGFSGTALAGGSGAGFGGMRGIQVIQYTRCLLYTYGTLHFTHRPSTPYLSLGWSGERVKGEHSPKSPREDYRHLQLGMPVTFDMRVTF